MAEEEEANNPQRTKVPKQEKKASPTTAAEPTATATAPPTHQETTSVDPPTANRMGKGEGSEHPLANKSSD